MSLLDDYSPDNFKSVKEFIAGLEAVKNVDIPPDNIHDRITKEAQQAAIRSGASNLPPGYDTLRDADGEYMY